MPIDCGDKGGKLTFVARYVRMKRFFTTISNVSILTGEGG